MRCRPRTAPRARARPRSGPTSRPLRTGKRCRRGVVDHQGVQLVETGRTGMSDRLAIAALSRSASPTRIRACGSVSPRARRPSTLPTAGGSPCRGDPLLISVPGTSSRSEWCPSGGSYPPKPDSGASSQKPSVTRTAVVRHRPVPLREQEPVGLRIIHRGRCDARHAVVRHPECVAIRGGRGPVFLVARRQAHPAARVAARERRS